MADNDLVLERIGRGDRDAVSRCIDKFGGLVWSIARRYLANEADAEEAVQEVFMEIWSSAGRYDPARCGEATFVGMIARRRVIDRLRKTSAEPQRGSLQDAGEVLSQDGQSMLEASAETRRVMGVIDGMKTEQRQVIHMSAWLGMSHAAIAERMAIPLGTVKSHLRRGLQTIRAQLGVAAHTANGEKT